MTMTEQNPNNELEDIKDAMVEMLDNQGFAKPEVFKTRSKEASKDTDQELNQSLQNHQQLSDRLAQMNAQTQAQLQRLDGLDWNYLRLHQPQEFQALQQQQAQLHQQMHALSAQEIAAQNQWQQIQQAQHAQSQDYIAREIGVQLQDVPELFGQMRDYLGNLGYAPQDIQAIDDPRHLVILHKALMYEKGTAAKQNALAQKPLPPRFMPAGLGLNEVAANSYSSKMKRLRSTGSIKDAADLIMDRI